MFLHDQTLGKPLKSQELEQRDHNITEGELEASHAVNGTSGIRRKRDLTDCTDEYLKDFCPSNSKYSSSGNGCEKGRYVCLGYHEAVCKTRTFSWTSSTACSRNIYLYGYPKCFPKYTKVRINTGHGDKCVWQTEYCSC
jgi:hypothetical protein